MKNIKSRETARKNVAAAMISEETIRAAQGTPVTSSKETKKRYNLVLLPSVYEDIQKIAYVERKSVSEIAGQLFADYVAANSEKLDEYKKSQG